MKNSQRGFFRILILTLILIFTVIIMSLIAYNKKIKTITVINKEGIECPAGLADALTKGGINITTKLSCKEIDQFIYKFRTAHIIEVTYGSYMRSDMGLPATVKIVALPSGEIKLDPILIDLKDALIASTSSYVLKKFSSIPLESEFLDLKEKISGPNWKGQYCGVFNLKIPFSGTLKTCTNSKGPFVTTGNIEWDKNIPSYDTLVKSASEFMSKTFPWKLYESTYGTSSDKYIITARSIQYDHKEQMWVFYLDTGYDAGSFIKISREGELSCIRSYKGLGSLCP
jgi:hypothetical protein